MQLVVEVEPELPRVRADPNQLRQVIGQPRRQRGRVLARRRRGARGGRRERRVGALLRERQRARDPPSEQRRIFEKFYRLDPNMTRGIGGTGLGLYISSELISSELVRRFDGRLWVDSQEGEGSTFHVELPTAAHLKRRRAAVAS